MNEPVYVYIQEGPRHYLKVVPEPGRNNEGMICLKHGHLWLKSHEGAEATGVRFLAGEIGNDFVGHDDFLGIPEGGAPCVGGAGYLGGVPFGAPEQAIAFLRGHFVVLAAPGNLVFTQEAIDACV